MKKRYGSLGIVARVACLALAALMLLSMVPTVFAAAFDAHKTVTMTFIMRSSDNTAKGGEFYLIKLADMTGDETSPYILRPEFSSIGIDFNSLGYAGIYDDKIAEEAADYVLSNGLEILGDEYTVDETGVIKIGDISTGLYLMLHSDEEDGRLTFKPFLATLPYYYGNTFHYSVIAQPKCISNLPSEGVETDIPDVAKYVRVTSSSDGSTPPPDADFKFKFESLLEGDFELVPSSDAVSSANDEIIVKTRGAGRAEIGKIIFKAAGDYFFRVTEINTHESGYKYDNTVYFCKYEVRENAERTALVIRRIAVKYDNANGRVIYDGTGPLTLNFNFINDYIKPPPDTETNPPDTETNPPDTETNPPDTETNPPDTETNPPDTETNPPDTETNPPDTETNPPDTETNPPDTNPPDTPTTPGMPSNNEKPEILPQTGQVWWPMVIMAVVGIICIAAGVIVSKRGRKDD